MAVAERAVSVTEEEAEKNLVKASLEEGEKQQLGELHSQSPREVQEGLVGLLVM